MFFVYMLLSIWTVIVDLWVCCAGFCMICDFGCRVYYFVKLVVSDSWFSLFYVCFNLLF